LINQLVQVANLPHEWVFNLFHPYATHHAFDKRSIWIKHWRFGKEGLKVAFKFDLVLQFRLIVARQPADDLINFFFRAVLAFGLLNIHRVNARKFQALSGSRTALPPTRPLRTARASFPACRSSLSNARLRTRFPYFQPLTVDLSMAIWVYQETVFCRVCTASCSPHDVVNVPGAEFRDVLLADRTKPLLFLPQIQQFPSALERSLH